jgi:hypothetical protein
MQFPTKDPMDRVAERCSFRADRHDRFPQMLVKMAVLSKIDVLRDKMGKARAPNHYDHPIIREQPPTPRKRLVWAASTFAPLAGPEVYTGRPGLRQCGKRPRSGLSGISS